MTAPVRTAFVGLGWWGTALADAALRTSGAIVVARGCGLGAEERSRFAGRFGCATTESFAQIAADTAIEAVVLATPHLMHVGEILAAARAGKHVFVEKPLTTTLADALEAVEAARSNSVILAVGHNRRLLSQVQMLKDLVAGGSLGRLLHVEANFSTAEAMALQPDHWRTSREQCPGGAMTVLGVHVIDWLHHLFGSVAEVSAEFRHAGTPTDMDDVSLARLTFASGLSASLTCLYSAPYTNRFVIHGTEATASVVGIKPESERDRPILAVTQRSGATQDLPVPFVDTLALQLKSFAAAVRGEGTPDVSGEEGAANVAVLDAMNQSAKQNGKRQPVRYGALHLGADR